MCLAVPMELKSRDGDQGVAETGGIRRPVRLDLVPDAQVGQFVIIHAGYAIQVMDEAAAAETLAMLRDIAAGPGEGGGGPDGAS